MIKRKLKKLNMNWNQTRRVFPKIKPFGDADMDGVKNIFDCKPFNKNKQGKGKYYMMYNKDDEYGLVHGRERLMSAKRILKNRGISGVKSYEYEYEE